MSVLGGLGRLASVAMWPSFSPADGVPGLSGSQVWSLTKFYSVDFSKSRIDVKSTFSTNAQSRFASVVVDGVLGPPRLALHI